MIAIWGSQLGDRSKGASGLCAVRNLARARRAMMFEAAEAAKSSAPGLSSGTILLRLRHRVRILLPT